MDLSFKESSRIPAAGKSDARLHRFAVLVASSTFLLIFVGGLVTSTDSGLAVPDWPLSYGQLFPRMVGGILYEHGHRMVASTVGFLIGILSVWLWRCEPRRWVRLLGGLAVLAVICQGVLGGITVLLLLPPAISISHAGLAEIVLCLTVSIAIVTSRSWHDAKPRIEDARSPSLQTLTTMTTAIVYLQILIGALMRHTGSGLAIPDFPLSLGHVIPPTFTRQILVNFTHRIGALVVSLFVIWVVARILSRHASVKALCIPAYALLSALLIQLYLGAETVWSGKSVVPTTLHVAGGAFILATSLLLTLTTRRIVLRQPAFRQVPVPGADAAME